MMKWLILLGFGASVGFIAYYYNQKFLDWVRFQSLGTRDEIVDTLEKMFIPVQPQNVLLWLIGGSAGLAILIFITLIPNWMAASFFALLFGMMGWILPKHIVRIFYDRRQDRFVLQMVDGLSLMSNALKSGMSIVQALGMVAKEMPKPMKQEFELILNENKLGVSIEECFQNLAKRVQKDDVQMFVTSINILRETGGNLAETFETIVLMIRERIKVEQKIKALTSQAFTQGMLLIGMVPLMGFVFYQSDPKFMAPMFESVIGLIAVTIILALLVAGFFAILKVSKIEV